MITYIDQNNAEQYKKYQDLFRKAEKELSLNEGEIATLQQYFGKIGDLVNVGDGTYRKQYTILPLDEDPFLIDANARTISVPKSFATNGVSVQGDQVAEILYFEIDRYFDATDLNNQYICIEWENAAGRKAISPEWVRDVESKPGKIIFGWALDNAITAKAGNVKFAVRFYLLDEENQKLRYSFGTQSAQITIKPTLNYDLFDESIEIVDSSDLVLNRIQNSIIGILPSPEAPYFTTELGSVIYGEDEDGVLVELEDKVNIKVGSYLAAAARGSGNISYVWYKAEELSQDADGKDTTVWAEVEAADKVAPNNESLCEIDSVGYYKVIAVNSYEANELYQNATESKDIVEVKGPTAPVVAATVAPIRVLGQGEDITLTASVEDANGEVSYAWQGYSDSTWMTIPGANANSYVATSANKYRCKITNTFNGSSKEVLSNEIEILNSPSAPSLLYPGYNAETGEYTIIDHAAGTAMTADVDAVEGKNYVYTWFKEDLTAVDDNFRGIDEITEAEETEETEKDVIVSDAEKAEFIYNDASEAKGRIHKPTYTTSGSGYYFCKVEEVLAVDGREYYGEPAYTRIYKILTLAQ